MHFDWGLVLGGFGLFMFGMKYMGDGLKAYAGNSMRELIDKYTTNTFLGVLIGCVVTVLVQSSSATSVIVIGFVRAGLMKLEQAAGVLLGASIGTTVTAFLIGLKVEKFALYFIFLGGLLIVFAKKKKGKYLGEIVMGFGALFYGLKIMGEALTSLVQTESFVAFTQLTAANPIYAFLAGLVVTLLLQSSSASIGVIQKVFEAGGIQFLPASLFVYAANIGTTITGLLASIGGSRSAKRTAVLNTIIKASIVFFFLLILFPYLNFVESVSKHLNLPPMMQLAIVHMIMNVAGVFVILPFIKYLVSLVKRIVPGNDPSLATLNVKVIDQNLAATHPFIALEFTKKQIESFKDVVVNNVQATLTYLNEPKRRSELKEIIASTESLIDDIDVAISNNLRTISKSELSERDMSEYTLQSSIIKNYERIGDLALNLYEFYEMVGEDKSDFSEAAIQEINDMYTVFIEMFGMTNDIYFNHHIQNFELLNNLENQLDFLEYGARNNHFKRIGTDSCVSNIAASVYCDVLSNLERMGDHCMNIARDCLKEEISK